MFLVAADASFNIRPGVVRCNWEGFWRCESITPAARQRVWRLQRPLAIPFDLKRPFPALVIGPLSALIPVRAATVKWGTALYSPKSYLGAYLASLAATLRFAAVSLAASLLAASACTQPLRFSCGDAVLLRVTHASFMHLSPRQSASAPVAPPQNRGTLPIRAAQGPQDHLFWDRQNLYLFSAVAVSRGLDYSSTLNMRRRGRQEILLTNDVVDNHAGFAAIEVAAAAVSVGASYLFHRYNHHRLERWTSIVHASLATSGAVRNYCLETAHPSSRPVSGPSTTP